MYVCVCVGGGCPGCGPLIAGTLVTNGSRIKTRSLTPFCTAALLMSLFCCLFLCEGEGAF